jgi:hypothetical protein
MISRLLGERTFNRLTSCDDRLQTATSMPQLTLTAHLCNPHSVAKLGFSADIDASKQNHANLSLILLFAGQIFVFFEKLKESPNLSRCKLCGKIVTHCRNHYRVHFPGKFRCALCGSYFTRRDNLLAHFRAKHPFEPVPYLLSAS